MNAFLSQPTNLIPCVEQEDDDKQEERLAKLSTFQVAMIRHAMKCKHTEAKSEISEVLL